MQRIPIPIEQLTVKAYSLWEDQWLLLSSGDFAAGHFNCMTISWGSLGVMWGRPFVQVVVRPQRYTFEFMEQYPAFTVCAFPETYRSALNLLGSRSGREIDKMKASGLTPQPASTVTAPVYAEAELAIECRKIYWQDFDPTHFIEPGIHKSYPRRDYHRMYFGEILAVSGIEK
jgi:flavin reductase (DIM6/NTAB) family NADH-FMN oxidoreductase RutF